jgi:hypothetical protein
VAVYEALRGTVTGVEEPDAAESEGNTGENVTRHASFILFLFLFLFLSIRRVRSQAS